MRIDPFVQPDDSLLWLTRAQVERAQSSGEDVEVWPVGLADAPALREALGHSGVFSFGGDIDRDHNRKLTPDKWRGTSGPIQTIQIKITR